MINFRVGILGAGEIAGKIADTLNKLDAFEPYAIASRDINKANEFGDKYNVEKRYGSYEELINDPDVELVYVATPHSHHAEHAKMCINAGKPVLVEKSFSYNGATTAEVIELAKKKNVFLGAAMWMRFLPIYKALLDYINRGVIGRVHNMNCTLAYDLKRVPRLLDPNLAGGGLLDLGVYPINLIAMIFGVEQAAIATSCARLETGIDAQGVIQFNFKTGRNATAFYSILYNGDNKAMIYGDKGYIEVDNMLCPSIFRVYLGEGKLVAEVEAPPMQISGYEYEFLAARDAIILGNIEFKEMPHLETLRIMSFMDALRATWKHKFPMEEE